MPVIVAAAQLANKDANRIASPLDLAHEAVLRAAADTPRLLDRIDAGTDGDGFAEACLVSASFFCEQLMRQAKGLAASVTAGPRDLYAIDGARLGL